MLTPVRYFGYRQANDDSDVDGIMVYYPIYGGRQVGVSASDLIRLP